MLHFEPRHPDWCLRNYWDLSWHHKAVILIWSLFGVLLSLPLTMTLLTLESIEHFTRSTEHVTPPLTSMIMAVVEIPSDLMAAGVYLYRMCQTKQNPHLIIELFSDQYVVHFNHGFRVSIPQDCVIVPCSTCCRAGPSISLTARPRPLRVIRAWCPWCYV